MACCVASIRKAMVRQTIFNNIPSTIGRRRTIGNHPQLNNRTQRCCMGSWQGHGTDLLGDSLAHNDGNNAKVILHGHSPSGFDVVNLIKNMDPDGNDEDDGYNLAQTGGIVHCAGSILAFPSACFLWKIRSPKDVTVESLAPIQLYRPKLEYLFLASRTKEGIDQNLLESIRRELRKTLPNLVVEALDVSNAMGTFNVLNGEDRRVAAAFILPEEENNDYDNAPLQD